MGNHFTNFTKEAMRTLGQELAAESRQRAKFVNDIHHEVSNLLADSHEEHCQSEAQRRRRAAHEAADRQSFIKQLRKGIRTLREGFQDSREEMAADFREMAEESQAARETFRNRPGQQANFHMKAKPVSQGTAKAKPKSGKQGR
jgi:Sec-independent protein translocase protein TatA